MTLQINGPVKIEPVKEPPPPPGRDTSVVWFFVGLVLFIGLAAALGK